ncbi:MAG: hypothetical protein VCD33_08290 [Alphaproteobacteria bacterium]
MTETPVYSRKRATIGGALTPAVYAAAGLSFYLYSGRAEGFVSPRLGPVLVTLTSVPLLFYLGMAPTFRFRRPGRRNRWLVMTGIIVGYLLIVAGYRLDSQLTADTMDQGDLIAVALDDYKRTTGAYPESLDQLNGPLPAPALVGSTFTYQRSDDGYDLAFPSVAFLRCQRDAENAAWRCDD